MYYAIVAVVFALAGFGVGVWFCKPVRDELKALRAAGVGAVKDVAGRI